MKLNFECEKMDRDYWLETNSDTSLLLLWDWAFPYFVSLTIWIFKFKYDFTLNFKEY